MCWTHTSRGLFKYGHLTYDRQTKVVRHILSIDNNTVIILLHEQIKTVYQTHPLNTIPTMEKNDTKLSKTQKSPRADNKPTGDDKPCGKYKAPKNGCKYEEEICNYLYSDAKELGIDLKPYTQWVDDDGVHHDGDTSDDSDYSHPGVQLVEIPRKVLIEVGKYPPPTAEQLADMPEPKKKRRRKK